MIDFIKEKLKSFDDIFTRVAENKKLNREGNLLMKMFPAYTPTGDYSGYKYTPNTSSIMPSQGGNSVQVVTDKSTGKQYRIMVDAKGKQVGSPLK